jgi:hypothetical protein
MERIAEGEQGFRGDFVSSFYLARLFEQRRWPVARNKRKEIMQRIGYVPHPGLHDGRVNNPVLPDNSKSVLYVKNGSMAFYLHGAVSIANAYSQANGGAVLMPNVTHGA